MERRIGSTTLVTQLLLLAGMCSRVVNTLQSLVLRQLLSCSRIFGTRKRAAPLTAGSTLQKRANINFICPLTTKPSFSLMSQTPLTRQLNILPLLQAAQTKLLILGTLWAGEGTLLNRPQALLHLGVNGKASGSI